MTDTQNQVQQAIDRIVESESSRACRSPSTATANRWSTPSQVSPIQPPGSGHLGHALLQLLDW